MAPMRSRQAFWASALAATALSACSVFSARAGAERLGVRPFALRGEARHASAALRPYGAKSVWNQRVPEHPALLPESDAIIALQFDDAGRERVVVRSQEAGRYDYGHPVYFASPRDPRVRIACSRWCDAEDNGGLPATIRIPAHALPAGGEDAHMAVVQPDGTEIDFGAVRRPDGLWGRDGNRAVRAGAAQNCGSIVHGSGFTRHGAVTVAGACLAGGLLHAEELARGRIEHALFLIVNCAAPASHNAYPVVNGAATDVCRDSGAPAPPLGGRLWLDYPDDRIAAMPLARWEKAILFALHDYGGFIGDDISGGDRISGVSFEPEAGTAFHALSVSDPFSRLGWSSRPVPGALALRYVGADPWQPAGVDFAHHLHYLAPCVTARRC